MYLISLFLSVYVSVVCILFLQIMTCVLFVGCDLRLTVYSGLPSLAMAVIVLNSCMLLYTLTAWWYHHRCKQADIMHHATLPSLTKGAVPTTTICVVKKGSIVQKQKPCRANPPVLDEHQVGCSVGSCYCILAHIM